MRCPHQVGVDRHFAGGLDLQEEHAIRVHLPECEACRARYERHLLLARLDPRAPPASERLGLALGFAPPRRRALQTASFGLALAAAASIALFVVAPAIRDSAFTARGSRAAAVNRLLVYRIGAARTPIAVDEIMKPDDELGFAYENTAEWERLFVFGVDEHRHVFWYHPAWRDAAESPVAIPISAEPGVHELEEAVKHHIDGERLQIFGVFTNDPISVREIEARIRGAKDLDRTGAASWSITVRVAH